MERGTKPKLVFTITRPVLAGAQQHVLELITGLGQQYEIVLISGRDDDRFLYIRAAELGIRYHVCDQLTRRISPINDRAAARALTELLRLEQPALVHAHSSKAGFLTRIVTARLGIPCIYTAHGWAFAAGTPFIQRTAALLAERFAAKRCRAIVTVSEADRRLAIARRIAAAHSITVIRNGISDFPATDTRFKTVAGSSRGPTREVRLVMVGRFSPQKDHACLLKALPALPTDTRLVLIGDGRQLPQVVAAAKTMGLTDRIDFLGHKTDVSCVLAGCDIFVLASRWEGFPISILEAMRAGLPVVAANVGGVDEAVMDDKTGLLYPSGDHVALANRLQKLIDDEPLRLRMGIEGREYFLRHFTARHMIDNLLPVYNDALESEQGAGFPLARE